MEIASTLDAREGLHENGRAEGTEKLLSEFGFVGGREHMARIHAETHSFLLLCHVSKSILDAFVCDRHTFYILLYNIYS
jgi:hypothetical protein